MIEDILAKASLKDLYGKKPLKVPNKPLDARKDTLGILSPEIGKAPQSADMGSWDDIKELLNSEVNVIDKMALMQENVDAEDALVALTSTYDLIRASIPTNQSSTLFGVDDRAPSRSEQSMFIRKLEVIENPRKVLDLLKANQLSMLEVDALQEFYPIYYQSLVENVLDQLVVNKEPIGRKKNAQLGILLGVPRVSPEALQKLQASYASQEEEEQPAPQEGQAPNLAEAQLTSQQKIEYK